VKNKRKKDDVRKKAGSICSRMSAALVHGTCAGNCFALDAAFQVLQHSCAALASIAAGFVYRVTGPFDSSMNTSTRAHSDIRTIYVDTV
jgi:hypothetical protein